MEPKRAHEIYLDIETLRLSYEVSGGWSNIRAFGLAVAVTWDEENGSRRWFEPDAERLIAELEKFPRIITFNGERFDLEVLRGYIPTHTLHDRSIDLLAHLKEKLGYRVKLDQVAGETLARRKTGTGEEVVGWWRAGQKEKVCRYCENDVQLLVELVDFARRNGYVLVDRQQVRVTW